MTVTPVTSSAEAAAALSWLEERAGPDGRWLPDATEVARLRAAADGREPGGWSAWFDPTVGYAAHTQSPGDLVPAASVRPRDLRLLVGAAFPDGGDAWIRDVTAAHPVLALDGVEVTRRLAVQERLLSVVPPVDGVDAFDPDRDAPALRRLIDDAYAGTPDGWTEQRIAAETARSNFEPADIVVARSTDAPGELDGAHWTMRRDEHTGEVHNLSVHPRARGQGLAHRLLDAGMARLAQLGCDRVILWVDEANEPGMRLYATAGFTTAWVDALVRLPPT